MFDDGTSEFVGDFLKRRVNLCLNILLCEGYNSQRVIYHNMYVS